MKSLSLRRIARLSAVFGLIAAGASVGPPCVAWVEREWTAWKEQPDPILATDEETAGILRAVVEANRDDYGMPEMIPPPPPPDPPLKPGRVRAAPVMEPPAPAAPETHDDEPPEPRDLILDDRTVDYCPVPELEEGTKDCAKFSAGEGAWLPDVPKKLRRELELANRSERAVSDPHLPHVILASSSTWSDLKVGDFWDAFYARFPGSAGTLHISTPVLTEDRSQALIYVAQGCGGLCGTGMVHLLQRTPSGWKQIGRWMIWIS